MCVTIDYKEYTVNTVRWGRGGGGNSKKTIKQKGPNDHDTKYTYDHKPKSNPIDCKANRFKWPWLKNANDH